MSNDSLRIKTAAIANIEHYIGLIKSNIMLQGNIRINDLINDYSDMYDENITPESVLAEIERLFCLVKKQNRDKYWFLRANAKYGPSSYLYSEMPMNGKTWIQETVAKILGEVDIAPEVLKEAFKL